MIHWLYERRLRSQLQRLPHHICFMITEQDMLDAPEKILDVTSWCLNLGITLLTFHVNSTDSENIRKFLPYIKKIASVAKLRLHDEYGTEVKGEGVVVDVAIGKSGREEIAQCIKQMANDGIDPKVVDEHLIESYLAFRYSPDLVIKTGGYHLTDFLIWQSVYSELYFSDINWRFFRKIDLLRALRDYQSRERRFGI